MEKECSQPEEAYEDVVAALLGDGDGTRVGEQLAVLLAVLDLEAREELL